MALEGAIQSSLSSWLGQGRLSTTISTEGNLARIRAYGIIRRGIEDGLAFRPILDMLKLASEVTGVKHTYGRGAMQSDWAIMRDNVGVQGSMSDKPKDYRAAPWDVGIGNPNFSRTHLHIVSVKVKDDFTGALRDIQLSFANDDLMTMNEILPYIDLSEGTASYIDVNEHYEDIVMDSVYKRP